MRGTTWRILRESGTRPIWLSVLLARLKKPLLNLSLTNAKSLLVKLLRLVGLATELQSNLMQRLSRGLFFSR